MSWPSSTFRTELPETIRREIDQLCATLVGNLSPQHKGDGSHHDLTTNTLVLEELFFQTLMQRIAEDRSTSDGGLRMDLKAAPNVTGAADAGRLRLFANDAPTVELGSLNVGAGLGPARPAIRFRPISATDEAWAIDTTADSFDQGLAFTDVTNANHVLVLYRTGPGNYALCRANNSLAALTDLGQPFAALRFDNVYAKRLHAQQGIFERGRATALGEWLPYVPDFASDGAPASGATASGAYTLIGNTCHFYGSLAFGAGTVFGSGNYFSSAPFNGAEGVAVGAAWSVAGASQIVPATAVLTGGNRLLFVAVLGGTGAFIKSNFPLTYVPGDHIRFQGTYQIA